jgi:hypothetical protein
MRKRLETPETIIPAANLNTPGLVDDVPPMSATSQNVAPPPGNVVMGGHRRHRTGKKP